MASISLLDVLVPYDYSIFPAIVMVNFTSGKSEELNCISFRRSNNFILCVAFSV